MTGSFKINWIRSSCNISIFSFVSQARQGHVSHEFFIFVFMTDMMNSPSCYHLCEVSEYLQEKVAKDLLTCLFGPFIDRSAWYMFFRRKKEPCNYNYQPITIFFFRSRSLCQSYVVLALISRLYSCFMCYSYPLSLIERACAFHEFAENGFAWHW